MNKVYTHKWPRRHTPQNYAVSVACWRLENSGCSCFTASGGWVSSLSSGWSLTVSQKRLEGTLHLSSILLLGLIFHYIILTWFISLLIAWLQCYNSNLWASRTSVHWWHLPSRNDIGKRLGNATVAVSNGKWPSTIDGQLSHIYIYSQS